MFIFKKYEKNYLLIVECYNLFFKNPRIYSVVFFKKNPLRFFLKSICICFNFIDINHVNIINMSNFFYENIFYLNRFYKSYCVYNI